ncbi:DUF1648 domain-containing protein [Ornithinibacillus halotolerans]|uniref:DUF1648 domain-containing protein n=1 Tax=Ornithinibacillus halotolerans TaxID=1274357 RepID=A0A916S9J8_9BACI|nr:DUF1648 domain-containing protein [Ornithinibacillus halotolerans]GGA90057.1 hypothetical protein GCM10008025_35810 [Ornithinibacillus halotolerans]
MKIKHVKITLFLISIFVFGYHILNLFNLWVDIPEKIAVHFTNDTPDNWGPKYMLFIMPILSIGIWAFIGLLVKKPEKLNYVNLTEANKEIQFSNAEKVLVLIQYLSLNTFILANEALLRYSVGMDSSIPLMIAVILLVICFIAPIFLLIWAATLKY